MWNPIREIRGRRQITVKMPDGTVVRGKAKSVKELIGQTSAWVYRRRIYPGTAPLRDRTRVSYDFWDKARRGKATGLEISGLLIKPVASKIAAWAMGDPPTFTMDSEPGREAVNKWWRENHATLVQGYEDSMGLGDAYLVINPDLTVTIITPDVVERIVSPDDYSETIGWKITERWPHPVNPAQTMTIEDEYYADVRIRRITTSNSAKVKTLEYPNLIGRIPVVQIANNRGINQTNGVSECEALTESLHEYGAIIEAALDGNKRQGRPTPTVEFKDVDALDKFFTEYGTTQTQELADGTTEQYTEIDFNSDNVMAIVGSFKYAQPGSFAGDTRILLEMLYYLYLEHTEIPEFVMGSAISSSRASAETQMPVWARFIDKKRGLASEWVIEVVQIVQAYMALGIEPGVVVEDIDVEWQPLTGEDGKLTLEGLRLAMAEGVIDKETFLMLLPVDVKNPADVIAKAEAEQEAERQAQEDQDYQAMFRRAEEEEIATAGREDSRSGEEAQDDREGVDQRQRAARRAA